MDFKVDEGFIWKIDDALAVKIMTRLDTLVAEMKVHTCPCCGEGLHFDHVDMYDHKYGWGVTPEIPKQWLSVHCPDCDYDISFDKLGVAR